MRPDPYAVSAQELDLRSDLPLRDARQRPARSRRCRSHSRGSPPRGVMSWVAFSSWQVSATCTSYPFPLWPL